MAIIIIIEYYRIIQIQIYVFYNIEVPEMQMSLLKLQVAIQGFGQQPASRLRDCETALSSEMSNFTGQSEGASYLSRKEDVLR